MKWLCVVLLILAALAVGMVCLTAEGAEYHSFYYSPYSGWSYGYQYAPPPCHYDHYEPRYYGYRPYWERPRYEFRYDHHHHRRHRQCR